MITKEQTDALSRRFQIDGFTVIREYLQLLFLNSLYLQKDADEILFKGGTAIRFLFGSPRFSENLDFSTSYSPKQIKKIISAVEKDLRSELPGVTISPVYEGKNDLRFRLKFIPLDFQYALGVRLDFQFQKLSRGDVSSLQTVFPVVVFPAIPHLTEKEILSEKMRAFDQRRKGRDLFDIWYLLKKGVSMTEKNKTVFLKRIASFPQKQLENDLAKFLPKSQRKLLPDLKEYLLEML